MAVEIGPGQEHETQHVVSLVDGLAVRQAGRPAKRRPGKLAGDKGYSAKWIRRWLRGIISSSRVERGQLLA